MTQHTHDELPDRLPRNGAVPTRYSSIRAAFHPAEADLSWAEFVAQCDPDRGPAYNTAGLFPSDRMRALHDDARQVGVHPAAAMLAGLAIIGDGTPIGVRVLLVGSGTLVRETLLCAERHSALASGELAAQLSGLDFLSGR